MLQIKNEAQINLGFIYSEGIYFPREINKAIHYYTLAANLDDPYAQSNLENVYFNEIFVIKGINKSIHYFTLAANKNHPKAQFCLRLIYEDGKYVPETLI